MLIHIFCLVGLIAAKAEDSVLRVNKTQGKAPLTVTVETKTGGGLTPYKITNEINFGDGTIEKATPCHAPADWCEKPGINKHTYKKPGTYTIILKESRFKGEGKPDIQILGTQTVQVK